VDWVWCMCVFTAADYVSDGNPLFSLRKEKKPFHSWWLLSMGDRQLFSFGSLHSPLPLAFIDQTGAAVRLCNNLILYSIDIYGAAFLFVFSCLTRSRERARGACLLFLFLCVNIFVGSVVASSCLKLISILRNDFAFSRGHHRSNSLAICVAAPRRFRSNFSDSQFDGCDP
jgi:hypothetical protein